jgi:2-polyprenyl-3-methyl-5-hydroxy-6-metoxy-1,4-benzoquinol methylase
MLNLQIRSRIEEAFNKPDHELYQKLQMLFSKTASDHLSNMVNNPKAIDFKIDRSLYTGDLIKIKGARILDFGSGCGFLACVLAASGADYVVGVEIDEARRSTAQFLANEVFQIKNIEFIPEIQSDEEKNYDTILLINVISHLNNPVSNLSVFKRLLKRYGLLFIEDNNNFGSFIVRRKLRRRVWPGEKWDGEIVYKPKRLNYIKSIYPNIPSEDLHRMAADTYGLTFSEIRNFINFMIEKKKKPFQTKFLRSHAPIDPETEMYHENAFRSNELEALLFNMGLIPISKHAKYIFDFKQNWPVSLCFKLFPRLSLYISPAFEILAIKK